MCGNKVLRLYDYDRRSLRAVSVSAYIKKRFISVLGLLPLFLRMWMTLVSEAGLNCLRLRGRQGIVGSLVGEKMRSGPDWLSESEACVRPACLLITFMSTFKTNIYFVWAVQICMSSSANLGRGASVRFAKRNLSNHDLKRHISYFSFLFMRFHHLRKHSLYLESF